MTALEETRLLPAIRRALREVVAVRAALETLESQLVVAAREQGVSWGSLATDLGITRQGARQRHLSVDPVAARRPKPASALNAFYAEFHAAVAAGEIPVLEPTAIKRV